MQLLALAFTLLQPPDAEPPITGGGPQDIVTIEAPSTSPEAATKAELPPPSLDEAPVPPPTIEAPPADEEVSNLVPPKEIERMEPRELGQGSAMWKPGSGLKLQTADGRFAMTLRLRVQLRYELQHDNEEDETRNAFSVRRARIQFKGHVFGKHNKYYLQIAVSPNDMGWKDGGPSFTPIRNWEISFDYLRDLTVTVGQMKVNYNRQRVISSGDLQLPDRSTVTAEFTLDRDVGLKLSSDDLGGVGYLRYALGIFNGEGRDGYNVDDMGMLYVARVELVPTGDADGDWSDDEVDWTRSRRPSIVLAGAYAFHDRAKRDRGSLGSAPLDAGTTHFHQSQADLMMKVAGFSLTSEFQWRKGIRSFGEGTIVDDMGVEVPAPRIAARNGLGYYIQAGFLIPRVPVEFTARWGQTMGIGDGAQTSLPDGDEAGAGVSWYIARHSLKVQTDYFRLRRDSFDVETQTFARLPWSDSVDQFRVQLQLAF